MFRPLRMLCAFLALTSCGSRAGELSDPTRPPQGYEVHRAEVRPEGPPPRLSAIMIGRRARHAVLNGHAVRVGDIVDDLEIVAIEPGKISALRNGQPLEIPLLLAVKKKPSQNLR